MSMLTMFGGGCVGEDPCGQGNPCSPQAGCSNADIRAVAGISKLSQGFNNLFGAAFNKAVAAMNVWDMTSVPFGQCTLLEFDTDGNPHPINGVTGFNLISGGEHYALSLYQLNLAGGGAEFQAVGLANAIPWDGNSVAYTINSITLGNKGLGYTSVPDVTLSGGGGNGATAVATVSSWTISKINIINGGSGYKQPPEIIPYNQDGAHGIGLVAGCNIENGKVVSVTLVSGGNGYTSVPILEAVSVIGGGGSGCELQAVIDVGQVVSLTITSVGSGYTSNPSVTITGGGGSGASGTATTNLNGTITSVYLQPGTPTGYGYTSSPAVSLVPSSWDTGSGAVITATIGSTSTFNLQNIIGGPQGMCAKSGASLLCCGCQTDNNGNFNYLFAFDLVRCQQRNLLLGSMFKVRGFGPQLSGPTIEGDWTNTSPFSANNPLLCCTDGRTLAHFNPGKLQPCDEIKYVADGVVNLPVPSVTNTMLATMNGGAPLFNTGQFQRMVITANYQLDVDSYCNSVIGIEVTNGGKGYVSSNNLSDLTAIKVTITGGGGTGATAAVAQVVGGAIWMIIATNEGSGYTSDPTVTIAGGGGTLATAVAFIENEQY